MHSPVSAGLEDVDKEDIVEVWVVLVEISVSKLVVVGLELEEQLSSSSPILQSFSPSHSHLSGMQIPLIRFPGHRKNPLSQESSLFPSVETCPPSSEGEVGMSSLSLQDASSLASSQSIYLKRESCGER